MDDRSNQRGHLKLVTLPEKVTYEGLKSSQKHPLPFHDYWWVPEMEITSNKTLSYPEYLFQKNISLMN